MTTKTLFDALTPDYINLGIVNKQKHDDPDLKAIVGMMEIVKDFIKSKQRIVYGSTAIQEIVKTKKGTIFTDSEEKSKIPDYDNYTPDCIADSTELANIFYKKGYPYVKCIRASHSGSVRVGVNFTFVCDFTFVPQWLYEQIPYKTINNIRYASPEYLKIDLYEGQLRPCTNVYRWKKDISRLITLENYFPMPEPPILQYHTEMKKLLKNKTLIEKIVKSVSMDPKVIISGGLAFNKYIDIFKERLGVTVKGLGKCDIPYVEVYSPEAKILSTKIAKLIKGEVHEYNKVLEHYPKTFVISKGKTPLAYIYDYSPLSNIIVDIKNSGKRYVNYPFLVKTCYIRYIWSKNKTIPQKMICDLRKLWVAYIEKTESFNKARDILGLFQYPTPLEMCTSIKKLECEERGKDERMMPYIPEKKPITPEEAKEKLHIPKSFKDLENDGLEV